MGPELVLPVLLLSLVTGIATWVVAHRKWRRRLQKAAEWCEELGASHERLRQAALQEAAETPFGLLVVSRATAMREAAFAQASYLRLVAEGIFDDE